METPTKPAAKKTADIQVLRCLNPACRGLLAYEVDSRNVLYVDLAWTARTDGEVRYFPCPTCHGRNIIDARRTDHGQVTHQVTRWEPGRDARGAKRAETDAERDAMERLELMPRAVRDKLDRVGLKLHLQEWQDLPLAERARLRDLPCERADEIAHYATVVEGLVRERFGKAPDRITPRP
jgi:hypothetical protein